MWNVQGATGRFRDEKIDECDIEKFGTLGIRDKTVAILGDRWWPQTAKQEGEKTRKSYVIYENNEMNAQILEVSNRSRNGAPSRKGCVVNGRMTKASNKQVCPPHFRT